MKSNATKSELWFLTGSQHLYGNEILKHVADHSISIAKSFDQQESIPARVLFKPVLKSPEEVYNICVEANSSRNCIGVIAWMHTFSPAKMWINGLKILNKPLLHLHTQFNRDIPWKDIDMNFMNMNQSAHGDREFGFIMSRMRLERKVITGHWQHKETVRQIAGWTRAALGWQDWQGARFVRFGDNMRFVAVTEGDKVEAEIKFGYSVNTCGVGDLVGYINNVKETAITKLCDEYGACYTISAPLKKGNLSHDSLRAAAKIEIGIRKFLSDGNYKGFCDTFEDLHGLVQLPGLPVQRIMADGYGFAAEGDWKTAALVRAMKTMASGLPGGNSFMEDYTYHLEPGNEMVLGSHMLEICSSIADGKPSCEVHPLGIGGKADPVRLVFNVKSGKAINASIVDLGNRFRMLLNEVQAIKPKQKLPKLPVARVLWKPLPDLQTACTAWIQSGGAHHTCYTQNLDTDILQDFAEMAGIECITINNATNIAQLKKELRWNMMAYD